MKGCPACEHLKPVLVSARKPLANIGVSLELVYEDKPGKWRDYMDDIVAFPTVMLFDGQGSIELDYEENLTVKDILDFVGRKKAVNPNPKRTDFLCTSCGGTSNISARAWGPSLWNFLHLLALSYPDRPKPADKEKFRRFLRALQEVLPCTKCKTHYGAALNTSLTNSVLANKESFFAWTVKFHSDVSNRTGGKSNVPRNTAHWMKHYANWAARAKALNAH